MTSASAALGPQSTLLLVDGHSLAYRAFYALPVDNFASPDGQPTNAIHGFISMLLQVVESEKPTHVAVAFDVSRETFRRAEFPDYKANRAASPVEFSPQVPVIREVLETFGIVNLSVEGFEADDIIATLAMAAAAQDATVLILTGDRDSFQLVNSNITVLYPMKGVRDLARLTPEAVETKYGVRPDQYADFAALRGDASDNLPSIPGVGEKTAATWLKTYGNLDGIVDNAAEVKGKVGEALRANISQVLLNRRLTQLVHDVPLNATVDDLHRHLGDASRIGDIFDRLGLKQLRKRAMEAFVGEATVGVVEPVEVTSRTSVAWTPGKLVETLAQMPTSEVGVYAEVNPDYSLDSVGFAWGDQALEISIAECKGKDLTSLWVFLSDPKNSLISHGAKGFERAAIEAGYVVHAIKRDTALLLYLLNPGIRGLDLAASVERKLHRALDANPDAGTLFDQRGVDVAHYAASILDLNAVVESEISDPNVFKLHDDLELPLQRLLAEMEHRGIAVDRKHLQHLDATFAASMADAEHNAHTAAGKTFNLGSPKQLQEILFEERGLPKTKKIKTGYTTDADALQWLADNTGDEVVGHILKWREVTKLRQTVAGLIPLIADDDRIHTTFQQTTTTTGRLSSIEPNLQNIPVRTAEGRMIRAAFVHGANFETLLTADYSQIEMRIMAHLSDDAGLIDAFNSGEDLHTTVGSQVFAVAPEDVTPEMRRKIKAMSYGLAYGLSSYGLSQQLGIEPREASALMDTYFERFAGVQNYLKEVVSAATRDGYTETMFGRRRYLPDLTSTNQQARAVAERMALNAPIQGSAADIIKHAMLNVAAGLTEAGAKSQLLLQVHDELVLEVAAGEKAMVEQIVREGMARAADLKVPLDVSVGYGANWDEAAH
ncbi:MAG: hypothetical protein RIS75_190 [Actinomycetota bacterium]